MSELLAEAENLPDKPTRSKLEPYADVILALRRKRYSYVEIADFLLDKAKVRVDPSSVWDFVKSQAKRGRRERQNTPPSAQEVPASAPALSVPPTGPPIPKQRRAVYVPPTPPPTAFAPDALKTNDQLDDS